MEEFIKNMTYLGLAYDKQYTQEEIKLYYDFLKDFNDDIIVKAIKEIIKTSKYIPKVTELVEKCESIREEIRFEVLEYMNNVGYFKDTREYQKASLFLERNVIPCWLQKDIDIYYKQMLNNRLSNSSRMLIE